MGTCHHSPSMAISLAELERLRRAIERWTPSRAAVARIECDLPDWITVGRRRLADLLWIAGGVFDRNLRAQAVLHCLPRR